MTIEKRNTPQAIEAEGRIILERWLNKQERKHEWLNGTFDLKVNGKYAELKATTRRRNNFNFLYLTKEQKEKLGVDGGLEKVFLVLGVFDAAEHQEVVEIDANKLNEIEPNEIVHYEWNKGVLKSSGLFP
jgi:hypothetical protein